MDKKEFLIDIKQKIHYLVSNNVKEEDLLNTESIIYMLTSINQRKTYIKLILSEKELILVLKIPLNNQIISKKNKMDYS